MKISKLFHWLYAGLMFLPLFSILAITLYVSFNQNAFESFESGVTLDNAFYYALEQVQTNSFFAWANNSFLAEPILYITELFGLSGNNAIITMLSYWLAISVIWLVFDLIMYIPLLVHRWIDKGMVE